MTAMRRGTVTEFDEAAGLGTVTASDDAPFRFHVVEIADGTRTVDVGQEVVFAELARLGEIQAGSIHKL